MVKVVAEIVSALGTAVTIKNSVVGYGDVVVEDQVLDTLVGIFHVWPLANVTHDTSVEPLNHEL